MVSSPERTKCTVIFVNYMKKRHQKMPFERGGKQKNIKNIQIIKINLDKQPIMDYHINYKY